MAEIVEELSERALANLCEYDEGNLGGPASRKAIASTIVAVSIAAVLVILEKKGLITKEEALREL